MFLIKLSYRQRYYFICNEIDVVSSLYSFEFYVFGDVALMS